MQRHVFRVLLSLSILVIGSSTLLRAEDSRFAIGLGAGLVSAQDSDVETYLSASIRIRVRRAAENNDDLDWAEGDQEFEDEYQRRDRQQAEQQGVRAYIEPEIGYWTLDSESGADTGMEDLLVGVNLIAVVPFGAVDLSLGAGLGAHFVSDDLSVPGREEEDTSLGANAQFGLDIRLNDRFSLFGIGRFDLVERGSDRVESKVYLGLRIHL